jgi:hypothetical protein
MRTGADQDDGTHVILPVADALAVSSDHARVPVMMLRHFMETCAAMAQGLQPRGPINASLSAEDWHGAPGLSAVVAWRIAAKGRVAFSGKEERRRWRRRSDSSHRLGRQDKAGCPARGAMRLKACLHVLF